MSPAVFVSTLSALLDDGRLGYQDGMLFLSGRAADVGLRRNSEDRSDQKRTELHEVLRICSRIPWIVGVAVTGSIAMRQAREQDDLDFLIVTKRRRLWLSRGLLVLFSSVLGKYRSRTNQHTNGWCFNMWLEESQLELPTQKRSIYTAFEVLQAEWIYDISLIQRHFLLSNSWVERVIPRLFAASLAQSGVRATPVGMFIFGIFDPILDLGNFLAYVMQRWHMHSVMTRELVESAAAHFHPRDTQGSIAARWRSIVRSIV